MSPNTTLRRERERHGWSQAHVARELGTDARTVGRWERGITAPSPHFRGQLCRLFAMDAIALGLVSSSPIAYNALSTNHTTEIIAPAALASSSLAVNATIPVLDATLPRLALSAEQVVGRQSLLDEITATLTRNVSCVLYGLPGVGKTTLTQLLVAQLTHLPHLPFPDGVLWINLGPSPDIHHELLRLATMLQIPEYERGQNSHISDLSHAIHRQLAERHLLFILDDAWNVQDIQPLLIGGPHVVHVITTRLPELAVALPYARICAVPELTLHQSQSLLSYLVPQLSHQLDRQDSETLQQALHFTGGLPLAVTLLAIFLRKQMIGGQRRRLRTALKLFSDAATRQSLPVPPGVVSRASPPSSKQALPSSTLISSLATIIGVSDAQLTPAAQRALRTLSVLPSKPASFSEAAALALCEQDTEVLDQLLNAGLLEGVEDGRYRMHQTINDYARLHLHDEQPYRLLVRYALDFSQHYADDNPALLRELAVLQCAWDSAQQHGWEEDQLHLTIHMDEFWYDQGYHHLALQRLQLAFAIAQKQPNALTICSILHKLSAHHMALGQVQEAMSFKQTLLQQSQQHGFDIYQARALNGLGMLACGQGNLLEAQTYYQQMLIVAGRLDTPLPRIAGYNNLGTLALEQGQFQRVEQLWQEGLLLSEKCAAQDWYCGFLYQLASLYLHWSSHCGQAEHYIHLAHALAETLHDTFETATVYIYLGKLAGRNSDYVQAEHYVQQAKGIVASSDHLQLHYRVCIEGARILVAIQREQQAETLLRSLPTLRPGSTIGLDLKIMEQLAWGELYLAQKRYDEAYEHFQMAQKLCPTPYALLHAQIRYGLARALVSQGDIDEAIHEAQACLQEMEDIQFWQWDEVRAWQDQLATAPYHQ